MAEWICYPNGPWWSFWKWFKELLKFWKWSKMKKSWIKYSIKQFFKRL